MPQGDDAIVADLAAQFNGHELGEKGATNADVFGVLALSAGGAPSDVIDTLAQQGQRVRERLLANDVPTDSELIRGLAAPPSATPLLGGAKLVPLPPVADRALDSGVVTMSPREKTRPSIPNGPAMGQVHS